MSRLIDKFKNEKEKKKLEEELISKVGKEVLKQKKENYAENTKSEKKENSELGDMIKEFLKSYSDSKKGSRMVRLQDENYKLLVKLKVHNIQLSEFVNFAIKYTTLSSDYSDIIKLMKKG